MPAEYYQAGLLTMVCVPSSEMEAARGVVRCPSILTSLTFISQEAKTAQSMPHLAL